MTSRFTLYFVGGSEIYITTDKPQTARDVWGDVFTDKVAETMGQSPGPCDKERQLAWVNVDHGNLMFRADMLLAIRKHTREELARDAEEQKARKVQTETMQVMLKSHKPEFESGNEDEDEDDGGDSAFGPELPW